MQGSEVRLFQPGETLFAQGEIARDLYLLIEGEIEILENSEVVSVMHQSGSLLGEMSYLTGRPRAATFRAKSPVKVMRIHHSKEIDRTFLKQPDKVLKLMRTMATRLDMLQEDSLRAAPYMKFRALAYEKAQEESDQGLLKFYSEIENEINHEQIEDRGRPIYEALDIHHLIRPIQDSVEYVMGYYYKGQLKYTDEAPFSKTEKGLSKGSCISFSGTRLGALAIFVTNQLAEKIAQGFLEQEEVSEELITSGLLEFANQLLGALIQKCRIERLVLGMPFSIRSEKDLLGKIFNTSGHQLLFQSDDGLLQIVCAMD